MMRAILVPSIPLVILGMAPIRRLRASFQCSFTPLRIAWSGQRNWSHMKPGNLN